MAGRGQKAAAIAVPVRSGGDAPRFTRHSAPVARDAHVQNLSGIFPAPGVPRLPLSPFPGKPTVPAARTTRGVSRRWRRRRGKTEFLGFGIGTGQRRAGWRSLTRETIGPPSSNRRFYSCEARNLVFRASPSASTIYFMVDPWPDW